MEDSAMFKLGQLLGLLWVFAWLPYAGWKVASTLKEGIFPPKKPAPQKDPVPRRAKRPKHTVPKEELKSKYNVLDSYDDEYKITNPVEFRT